MILVSTTTSPRPAFQVSATYRCEWNGTETVGYPDQPQALDICLRLDTPAEAEEVAATFPKSARLYAGTLNAIDNPTAGIVVGQAKLAADAANGGTNETAVKRYRAFLRQATARGWVIEWVATAGNAYATQAEFEQAIA